MPMPKKPRKPRQMPLPPDDKRCTAISARTEERCTNWAAWRKGLTTCSGHAQIPLDSMERGKSEAKQAKAEEAERVALAGAEGQLADATRRLEVADPLDVEQWEKALTEKQLKEAQLEQLRKAQAAVNAAKLQPPVQPGFVFRRSYVPPGHQAPKDAMLDENGAAFTWAAHPVQTINSVRRAGAQDPEVARIREERQTPVDVEEARRLEREERAILDRAAECARAPHAASVYGAPLGLDAAEYLDHLDSQLQAIHGLPVDLNAPPDKAPEFEQAILPAIRAKAERNAWAPTRPLRLIG